jgi:Tol biopolymer transport system component
MSHETSIERVLELGLADIAPTRAPETLIHDVASTASHERQRPNWLASLKEPPMRYRSQVVVGSPTARLVVVAALAAGLLLALASIVVAGAALLPSPAAAPYLLAFDEQGNIVTAASDGTALRTFTSTGDLDESPQWSPDGNLIAFVRSTSAAPRSIVIAGLDGATLRTFRAPTGSAISGPGCTLVPTWSPGGDKLAVTEEVDTGTNGLIVFDVPSGGARVIDFPAVMCGGAWSPDGSMLVAGAADQRGVFVVSPDGGGLRRVTPDGVTGWLGGDANRGIFSPDGSTIVFTEGLGGGEHVATIGLDGQGLHDVASAPSNNGVFSPDGRSIAYVTGPLGVHDANDLYVANVDGTGARLLAHDVCGCAPNWAPDGSLVGTWNPAWDSILIVPVDGSPTVTLPDPARYGLMSWQAVAHQLPPMPIVTAPAS